MDKATSGRGPQVGPGGGGGQEQRSPQEIRREIEETRGDLGDTVEALAEKTDVKGQAKQRVEQVKQTAQQKKQEFVGKAKAASPDSARGAAQRLATTAREKPIPVALGGALAIGFVLGRRGRSRD